MQKSSVDKRLGNELEKYFKQKDVRGVVVNVENNNPDFLVTLGITRKKI